MPDPDDCSKKNPLFTDLDADQDPETTQIESLCMNCRENGITKLLLTRIPFYKEVVIMSFNCENCGFNNNEIQPGGEIREKGVRYTLSLTEEKDMNRQVVKSDFTCVRIPHLEFEIPSQSQKGEVTTVEGIINRSIEGLKQDQEKRRAEHPEAAKQIDSFVEKLEKLKLVQEPFTMVFEDISGDLFVENPRMPEVDRHLKVVQLTRSGEQDRCLGVFTREEVADEPGILHEADAFTLEDLQSEVLSFATNCPECAQPCQTNMKVTDIPYFKQVVIMATCCESCGHRTNEVKSGGGIEPQGVRIEVTVDSKQDLCRDILKSETCSVTVADIGLEVGPTTFGGKFTTVEGLLAAMRDQLFTQSTIFSDSRPERQQVFDQFLEKLNALIKGDKPFSLVLDDPAGNSFIQSFGDHEPDKKLKVTKYDRTYEQNDDLGLNDIKTEGYEEDT